MATILIVDDQPTNRDYLVTLLGYGGHRLLEAGDGVEALALARAEHPDLVIADVLMPTMDGFEFVRQLRADPAIAGIPVVFYTAHYHEREARSLADACGVAYLLTKPAEPEVVLRTVNAALGVATPEAAPPLAAEFDREHLRLVTNKLSHNVDELKKLNERLTVLIGLGMDLASERDPHQLLRSFCHRARDVIGAGSAVVGVVDKETHRLRRWATSGLDATTSAKLDSLNPAGGLLGDIMKGNHFRRRLASGTLSEEVGFPQAFPSARSILGAPIVSPTKTYGWLCLFDKIGDEEFSAEDERLAGILAGQVGRIYENGSLYADLLRQTVRLENEVAERKRVEASLRESEEMFRGAFEFTNVATVLTNVDNRFLRANSAFTSLFGYSHEEMLTLGMKDLTHPDDLAESYARRETLLSGKSHFFQMEKRYLHKDGHQVWGLTNVSLVRDAGGRPVQYVGQVQDITERKRAELRLAIQHAVVCILAEATNLRDAVNKILQAVGDTFGWVAGDVWEVDPQRNVLTCVDLWHVQGANVSELHDISRRMTFARGTGLPGRAWASGQCEWIFDIANDATFLRPTATAVGLRGAFAFPVHFGGDIFGVVEFFSRECFHPDDELLRMFSSLGSQIGQFVQRTRAEEALAERARMAELEATIGVTLTQRGTLATILEVCVQSIARHLDVPFVRVWTLNQEESVLEIQASGGSFPHPEGPDRRIPVGRSEIGRIAQDRRALVSNDVLQDSWISDPTWARRENMIAFAGHPLLVDGELVGVMALFARKRLGSFTLRSLSAVADLLALAIQRKRAEDQLRSAQQRLQDVVRSSPAVLFTQINPTIHLRPTWISENMEDVLGYSVAEVTQPRWWIDRIHPDDRPRVLLDLERGLFEGSRVTHEHRFLHADGRYRWVGADLRILRDASNKVTEIVGSWSDVTERKHLEEQFRQSQKMDAVGRLAGGVAHDFNNLLTVITGYGELLLIRLPREDPAQNLIREMVSAGNRAAGLTRQLLAFSRKTIVEPKILHLENVVADLDKMLRRVIGEDIGFSVVVAAGVGTVKADPGQIEQVLLNLVVNARDAMPRGGKLTIEVCNVELEETYTRDHPDAKPGPHVLLAISDTGHGMDQETMARAFEPFFTTKGDRGTGLGLATVHGIVKQSGGHVAIYSELGRGTTFKVYLPRTELLQPTASKSSPGMAVMPLGKETILLVEDEDAVRALVRHALLACGYTLLEGRDGMDALRIAEHHKGTIDLVVTDVVMPKMGGREVANQLTVLRPGIKVLFLSGYTDDAVVRHGILKAEVAFLQKPFGPAALAAKVREVLDQPAPAWPSGTADPATGETVSETGDAKPTIRVLLVDDHSILRSGLRKHLQKIPGIEIIGEASDGREAILLARDLHPDIVFMDIGMPGLNGIEATGRLTQDCPGVLVIMLSMHSTEEFVWKSLRAGAAGYLQKDARPEEIALALDTVARGESYITPIVSKHIVAEFIRRGGSESSSVELLTSRQREILQLLAEGKTTKEIARILSISAKTVETHRAQVMERLDIHDLPGLVRYAIRVGLVQPDV